MTIQTGESQGAGEVADIAASAAEAVARVAESKTTIAAFWQKWSAPIAGQYGSDVRRPFAQASGISLFLCVRPCNPG